MLVTEPYLAQRTRWPRRGRHVLAQHDDDAVVVYQAFRPSIAREAVSLGAFGREFGLSRMSWVKPNFLWMMFRCGWATKEAQEAVVAVTIQRSGFERMLAEAVHSTFVPEVYGSHGAWKRRLAESEVRLQWDPDHDPHGHKVERRAVQLGLSGEVLRLYAKAWIKRVDDVTDFVRAQHAHVCAHDLAQLVTPREAVYEVGDREVAARLGVDREDGE